MRYLVFSIFLLLCRGHEVVRSQNIRNGNNTTSQVSPTIYCHTSGFVELTPGKKVNIAKSSSGMLCTLTRVNGKEYVPVARSYDNHPWEATAGFYATKLKYFCDDHSCEIDIPEISKSGDAFHLQGFERKLSKVNEAARFFEQATFGVTQTDLIKMSVVIDSEKSDLMPYFARWVYEQSYEELPTSHRAFWRERTKPTYETKNREGRMTRPCEQGSLWRGYSFTPYDEKKYLTVKSMNGRLALEVNGQIRTMVDSFVLMNYYQKVDLSERFKICVVDDANRQVRVYYNGKCHNILGGNPPVSLLGMSPQPIILSGVQFGDISRGGQVEDGSIEVALSKQNIEGDNCNIEDKHFYTKVHNGNFVQDLIFEPRLVLERNLLESPMEDGGKSVTRVSNEAQCPNAPRTFLNEEYCRLSKRVACVSQEFSTSGKLKLSPANLKSFFMEGEDSSLVYAIVGLRLDKRYQKSPCVHGIRSRWKLGEQCQQNVHDDTASILRELLEQSNDTNNFVRDLFLPPLKECHPRDINSIEMEIQVGEQCWKTVHPDLFNVYDFSVWGREHPGNSPGFNPIKAFARIGSARLSYPESHSMERWDTLRNDFPYLGRLGDNVNFDYLPDTLRTKENAELFGLTLSKQDDQFTVVCGSPYETENVRNLSPSFAIQRQARFNVFKSSYYEQQRRTVWTTVSMSATDQLRQRVAW